MRRGQDSFWTFSQVLDVKHVMAVSAIAATTCIQAFVAACGHVFSPVVTSFVPLGQTRFAVLVAERTSLSTAPIAFVPLRQTPLVAERAILSTSTGDCERPVADASTHGGVRWHVITWSRHWFPVTAVF